MKIYKILSVFLIVLILHNLEFTPHSAASPIMLAPESFVNQPSFVGPFIESMDNTYLSQQGITYKQSLYQRRLSYILKYISALPEYLLTAYSKGARFIVMTGVVLMFNATKVIGQIFKNSDKVDIKTTYYDDGGWRNIGVFFNVFDTTDFNISLNTGVLEGDTTFSFLERSPYLKAQFNNRKIRRMSENLTRLRWNNLSLGFAPLHLNNPQNSQQTSMPLFASGFSGGYLFDYSIEKVSSVLGISTNLNYYMDVNTGQYFIFSQKESMFFSAEYYLNSANRIGIRYSGDYLVGPVNAQDINLKLHPQEQSIMFTYLSGGSGNFFMISPGISISMMERTKGVLNVVYGDRNIQADVYAKLPLNKATQATIFDNNLQAGASVAFDVAKSLKVSLNTQVTMKNKEQLDKFYIGGKFSFNIGSKKTKKVSSSLVYGMHGNVPTEGSTLATYKDSVFINNRNASNMVLTIGQDSIIYSFGEVEFGELTAIQEQYLAELDRQLAEGEIEAYEYRAAIYNFHMTGGHVPIPAYQLPETYDEFVKDMQNDYSGDQKVLYIVSALASYMNDNNYNDEAVESFSEYKRISKLSIDEVYSGIVNSRVNPDDDNYIAVCAGIHRLATDVLKKCGFEAYNMAFNTEDGVYHMVSMAVVDGTIYFIDYDNISSYGTDNPEYALMLFSNQKHNTVNVSGMYVYDGDNIKHVNTPDSRLIESALGVSFKNLEVMWSAMSSDISSSENKKLINSLNDVIDDAISKVETDSLAEAIEYIFDVIKNDHKNLRRNFSKKYIIKAIRDSWNIRHREISFSKQDSIKFLLSDNILNNYIFMRSA